MSRNKHDRGLAEFVKKRTKSQNLEVVINITNQIIPSDLPVKKYDMGVS